MTFTDTISALSTPPGRAALALIRVSGPESLRIIESLTESAALEPRHPSLRVLRDGDSPLDEAVVTYYKAPNSFTGEDLVEICCHGNPVIVERILAVLVSRGTRPAEAGEFSRRALAHGKLSVEQLESMDIILNSSTQEGVEWGLRAKLQSLGLHLEAFRAKLLRLTADVEARLDFPDHEVGEAAVESRLSELVNQLSEWVTAYKNNRRYLRSRKIVLLGPPNSGKSSLFNLLLGRDQAIVFDQPGTTRDLLESPLHLSGEDLVLVDTAGLRDNADPIEALGIEKARSALSSADTVVWMDEKADLPPKQLFDEFPRLEWILCQSKSDVSRGSEKAKSGFLPVSVKTREGVEDLRARLSSASTEAEVYPELLISSDRQLVSIEAAHKRLNEARDLAVAGGELEWTAEKLREAARELEHLLGGVSHQEVLDSILARFCIGK